IAQPPSLGAMAPAMSWSDPGDGARARGGAMELGHELIWALEQGIDDARRRGEPVQELIDELDHLLQTGFWELPAGAPALRHGVVDLGGIRADPTVADAARVAGRHDRVQIPVLSIGGWYDCFAQGVLDNHCAVAAGLGRLIVGPWTHANFTEGIGELSFGLRARSDDLTALQLSWFRAQLTEGSASAPDAAQQPVRIFVMGADRWRDEPCWPPPGSVDERWYLRAGGGLTRASPDGADPASEFVYDPADPVPTLGGATLIAPFVAAGPIDHRSVEERHDVLAFTSEPLEADLEVTGRVRVILHAQSSAPATDWVARLCDVHPDGNSYGVCDGILRVARGARELARHELDLWSTSNVFRRGHRLRVQVTSSCFPRWDRNLNTGDQRGQAHVPARQRVSLDAEHPSYVELPVLQRA
ncbi:MAG: CocE/NonD family hydrolase, partial [Solirubrobacteraceae bacterium]